MTSGEIRKKYLDFFKAHGHVVIPSASLVPENDPTTLFTGSGMQPLLSYLLGASHPEGRRLVNSQKCFRAEDIDEVGDNRHTTFFEMLGNWSLGDEYWKQEQLAWFLEFLTEEVGLDPKNLYVTVFSGGEGIPRDDDAIGIWKRLFSEKGVGAEYAEMNTEDEAAERGIKSGERIFGYGVKKNWWSRAGVPSKMPVGEPGGPDSEVFYDFDPSGKTHTDKFGKHCHPNCDCGRFMEIGNSVFMEYKKVADPSTSSGQAFEKLKQRNVDFGGGLERITAASNNDSDVFNIDTFSGLISQIHNFSAKPYEETLENEKKSFRIIADHIRASVFLMGDGVMPGNKERNYLVRQMLRRSILHMDLLHMQPRTLRLLARIVITSYGEFYPNLLDQKKDIEGNIGEEEEKFRLTLQKGHRELVGLAVKLYNQQSIDRITGHHLFEMYSTYGYPLSLSFEDLEEVILPQMKLSLSPDFFNKIKISEEFETEFEKHRNLSRTSSAGTFKGGLADHSEQTTKLHTAHHLLLKALQMVLGPEVKQRGSNITSERLRMDFSYDGKMTDEQKNRAEQIVNEKIMEDLPVIRSEMPREEAEKLGAEHEFGQKYPERVSVYSVGPKIATQENPQFDQAFSIEFCGGPHVTHTGAIGKFRIIKEEAVAAGIRRIRGIVE